MKPIVGVLLAASLAVSSGCRQPSAEQSAAAAGAKSAEENVLNIYNWSDYIDESVLEAFTAETGIKVVYDNFDSSETLETKLLTGSSGYDIVVPSAQTLSSGIQAGVFLPLDKARLKNWGNLDPEVLGLLQRYDHGNQHAIPYMWGTTGIGYNIDKVKAILGKDAVLDTYDLLFKPENMAKLQKCGVTFLDAPGEVLAAALHYLGKDPASNNEADYLEAQKLLLTVRPYMQNFNNAMGVNDLASGEICVAMGWSGDVTQSIARAKEAGNGVRIAYAIPREGTEVWIDTMAIPKDAPHPENALRFIDYIMRPKVAAAITNVVGYPNGNAASRPYVLPEILNDPTIYPGPELRARLYAVPVMPGETRRVMTRVWSKVKTGA